ncbi:MAG: F0F1 ATP synthase subunit A, partial [Acidobacteriota bacterium]
HKFDLGLLTPEGVVTVLSDQILMIILAGLILCIVMPWAVRQRRSGDEIGGLVATGLGNMIEMVCEYFRKEVAEPAMGKYADKYVKYVWSVFFFVLTMNLLGLLPIQTLSKKLVGMSLGGTATGNIWVTGTLALLTLLLMVIGGLRYQGGTYLAHFNPGPVWMAPILVPIEIISTLARTVALAIRLFVAMLAGHILLAVLFSLIFLALDGLGNVAGMPLALLAVVASVAINLLEIFVASLQAFIFAYLTALFIGMSVNLHHDDHHDEAVAGH